MNGKDVQLKEYETLRQEIMDHQDRREKLFVYTITALGIVLGFIVNASGVFFAIVSFVPYLIIFNYCKINYIYSAHIITVGTYLRHFVESNFQNVLQWETIWHKLASEKENGDATKTSGGYWKGGGYWYQFFLIASIASLVGVVCLSIFTDKFGSFKLINLIFFIFLQFFFFVLCLVFGVFKIHWSRLNKKIRYERNKLWTNYSKSIAIREKVKPTTN